MKKQGLTILAVLMVFSFVLAACGPAATEEVMPTEEEMATEEVMATEEEMATEEVMASDIDCMGAQPGDEISMLYQWSGAEEENLNNILRPFVEACGVVISPESTRDQALLDTRVQAGTPPDITFWNVTQLTQYKDLLVPMTDLGVHEDNYADYWKTIGTVDGMWLGLPVKADPKTLVWYSPANFTAAGYDVPTTWDELDALVEQMVADGVTAVVSGYGIWRCYWLDRYRLRSGYHACAARPRFRSGHH